MMEPSASDEMTDYHDIVIVGGGAAGMFAAAILAEQNRALSVLVLEKGSTPLAKVRISGGGRCNLTHACPDIKTFVKNYPRGGPELIGPLTRFGPTETTEWFTAHGVPVVTLEDGCVFPQSNTSSSVVRALLEAAATGAVEIRTQTGVRRIVDTAPTGTTGLPTGFLLELDDGRRERCRKLLIATGGGAFPAGLGHVIEPCVPSLFTFRAADRDLSSLSGIVVKDVQVQAVGLKATGDLLITHAGVSGPAILRLSSWGARRMADLEYRFELKINFCPSRLEEELFADLSQVRADSPRKHVGTFSPLGLSARLWRLLVAKAGVEETREWGALPTKALRHMAAKVSGFLLPIAGRDTNREEFVTCGGIRLKEVNFKTMESKLCPGLHFAGEVLDIDALTGGFNLQAAWTTGYCAAQHLLLGNEREID